MNRRMNVVLTAERRQYTPILKFKSSKVNLLTLLTAVSDNQTPCECSITYDSCFRFSLFIIDSYTHTHTHTHTYCFIYNVFTCKCMLLLYVITQVKGNVIFVGCTLSTQFFSFHNLLQYNLLMMFLFVTYWCNHFY